MTSVYKVGGPALEDASMIAPLADEVRRAAGRTLLVHGGGRYIEKLLKSLAIESRFVDGRRATSTEAMDVVEMVLSGLVNKQLTAGLVDAGVSAIGISGRDAGLIRARLEPGLGRVGTVELVDARVVESLWAAGYVPVVSPVSAGPNAQAVNINADEAAQGLALALKASALIYFSDVDGVRADGGVLETLTHDDARRLIDDGTITGGMALKVRVALAAVEAGIPEVVVAGKARLLGGFGGTRITAV